MQKFPQILDKQFLKGRINTKSCKHIAGFVFYQVGAAGFELHPRMGAGDLTEVNPYPQFHNLHPHGDPENSNHADAGKTIRDECG